MCECVCSECSELIDIKYPINELYLNFDTLIRYQYLLINFYITANIAAIHENRYKSQHCLTTILCKIMESIIKHHNGFFLC